MEHLNKRKPNLLFFWFLLPFILYGGYAVGKLEGERISIENIREMTLYSLTHPWPPRFTVLTIKAVLILILVWVFAVIWYVGNYRSLIPGLEYGSAKFADPGRVNEKLEDADVRVELDLRNEKLGYKIREARMDKVPYMVIVGESEQKNGSVSVRQRDAEIEKQELGEMSLDELIELVKR